MEQLSCWRAGMPLRRLTLAGLCVITAALAADDAADVGKLLNDLTLRTKVAESAAKFAINNAATEVAKGQLIEKNLHKAEETLATSNAKIKEALDLAAERERSLVEAQASAREAQKTAIAEQNAAADAAKKAENAAAISQKAMAEDKRHIAVLEASLNQKAGPAGLWIESLSANAYTTFPVVIGVLGLCSVFGPAIFMKFFFALVGTGVGGLMFASCLNFFFMEAETGWLGSLESLLMGTAPQQCYLCWILFVVLGLVRYKKGAHVVLPGRYYPSDLDSDFIDTRPLFWRRDRKSSNGSDLAPPPKYSPPQANWENIPPPPTMPDTLKGYPPKATFQQSPPKFTPALAKFTPPPPPPPKYTPPQA